MTMKDYIIRYIVVIALLMLSMAASVSAQSIKDFTYSHLGQAEGMLSQRVYSILQTTDGALWWATKQGVERYNGVSIKHYALDSGSIYSSFAGRTLRLTHKGDTLYAYDNKGCIYIFNEIHDCFDLFVDLSKQLGDDALLNDLLVTDEGMWLAMYQGIFKFKDGKLTPLREGLWSNCVINTRFGPMFGTKQGLLDRQMKQMVSNEVETGYYDEKYNKVWLGGFEGGLRVLSLDDRGTDVGHDFFALGNNAQQNPVRSFCPYDDETMLIGIDGLGVYVFSRKDDTVQPRLLFDANEGAHGVLHGNGIYSVVLDSWKNIVIGSYSGGIDIARPVGSTMAVYEHVRDNQQTVSNDRVNSVAMSGSRLLLATDNGISILNTATGTWQHICQGTVVIDLFKAGDGRLLASTFGKGVYEVSANGNARQIYSVLGGTLKDDHVYASLIDRSGNLWIGCLYGELMMKDASGVHYYPIDNVQCIIQLPDGEVAVGTANGIKLFKPGQTEIGELNYMPDGVNDANRYVISMFVNQGRELWIATDGGGVYIYDLTNKSCRQLTTANGLPSNCVSSLIAGTDGRVWIATEQGLAFVSPDNPEKAIDVNYCYGLAREYSSGAVTLLDNGEILFGSTTGAVRINPKNIQAIDYTTHLHIMGVSCGDDDDEKFKEQVHEMLANDELQLSYGQNTFDLYYESINLRNQYDIAYQYQVGNGEWSQLTDQQYIRFTNLVPGKHRLLLRAVSRTSGTVLDEKALDITIRQPWWNSWWMWCVYLALLALAFYGAWRIYQLHNKYMRLTIDHLQLTQKELADNASQAVKLQEENEAVKPSEQPVAQAGDGKDFVDKATRLIVEHLGDSDFSIDKLCREMAMSRTLFYVKLKSYTGKSPQDFIRVIRLERAAVLLRNGNSVTTAATLAGFENSKYFSTVFKKYFGVSPSKYSGT